MTDFEKNEFLPAPIKKKVTELNSLVEKYPEKIPAAAAAKFMSMDIEVLRRAIEQGQVPFAIGCKNGTYGNRYAYVATMPFYFWFMSPILNNRI